MTSRDHHAVALVRLLLTFVIVLAACPPPALADLMVIGNDEKVVFDAEGNRTFGAGSVSSSGPRRPDGHRQR